MPSSLEKIKKLIPCLPKKDIPYAEKFLKERDYEKLKDLTWSSLEIVEKSLEKSNSKYADIDLDKLRELAVECNDYYYFIFPEELEIEDDFDDTENIGEEFLSLSELDL